MVIDVVNILRFLRSLTANNRREWLDENRIWYEEARTDFESLIQLLLNRISLIDSSYLSVTPKDSTFRIYRNLRFSKDKTPFKTHWGAYMNPYGRKSNYFGFYLHLSAEQSFVGGGSISLPYELLQEIREQIVERIDEYRAIVENPSFKRYFPIVGSDFLKTAPKGFSVDYPYIDYLRCKEFTCSYNLFTDSLENTEELLTLCTHLFEELQPYAAFINSVVKEWEIRKNRENDNR